MTRPENGGSGSDKNGGSHRPERDVMKDSMPDARDLARRVREALEADEADAGRRSEEQFREYTRGIQLGDLPPRGGDGGEDEVSGFSCLGCLTTGLFVGGAFWGIFEISDPGITRRYAELLLRSLQEFWQQGGMNEAGLYAVAAFEALSQIT